MTPERWKKLKRIFHRLQKMSPHDREGFLREQCGEDAELWRILRRMLEAENLPGDFLSPPQLGGLEITEAENGSQVGMRIGVYRLERLLARGGMGEVYLAVREDQEVDQRVAIKLIRHAFGGAEIRQRFLQERQTLARLSHPYITRLLDAGTTPEGVPYLVMEYIDGVPVDQYCDAHNLTVRARLELFLKICEAVQYAHQNLVIHRDLKPGNILIDEDGNPRLLDFGIAKLLQPEDMSAAAPLTREGLRFMTPEYASPEQVRGEPVTTASDVYSLGVLLFRLLTGHPPYAVESTAPLEVARTVCQTEPARPSSMVLRTRELVQSDGTVTRITPQEIGQARRNTPGQLRRQLKGDLDAILLKSLRKEAQRRYASVEQLAQDIRRHLNGLPVQARGDQFGYRMMKFVRRHRLGLSAVGLILLFLLAAVIGISREAKRAQQAAMRAERMVAFLKETLSVIDPYQAGKNITVRELLDNATRRVETELSSEPEIEGEIRTTLGITYQNLGMYDQAEEHLQRALSLVRQRFPNASPEMAAALKHLALLRHYQGDLGAADSLFRQSLHLFRETLSQPTEPFAEALNDYALLLNDLERYPESEQLLWESLAMYRQLRGREDSEVASVLNNLAVTLDWQGKSAQAESLYNEALTMYRRVYGPEHPQIAYVLNNLAFIHLAKGDTAGTLKMLRESLTMRQKLLGKEHPDVALATHNLGVLTYQTGDYQGAEKLLTDALRMWESLQMAEHPSMARSLYWLGKVKMDRKRYLEAEALFSRCLEICRRVYPEGHEYLAKVRRAYRECLSALRQTR